MWVLSTQVHGKVKALSAFLQQVQNQAKGGGDFCSNFPCREKIWQSDDKDRSIQNMQHFYSVGMNENTREYL